jgi:hypothetical protein
MSALRRGLKDHVDLAIGELTRRQGATLHGVVFDILVGSESRVAAVVPEMIAGWLAEP